MNYCYEDNRIKVFDDDNIIVDDDECYCINRWHYATEDELVIIRQLEESRKQREEHEARRRVQREAEYAARYAADDDRNI